MSRRSKLPILVVLLPMLHWQACAQTEPVGIEQYLSDRGLDDLLAEHLEDDDKHKVEEGLQRDRVEDVEHTKPGLEGPGKSALQHPFLRAGGRRAANAAKELITFASSGTELTADEFVAAWPSVLGPIRDYRF